MVYAIIDYTVHKCTLECTIDYQGSFVAAFDSATELFRTLARENEAGRRIGARAEAEFLLKQASSPRMEEFEIRWVEKRLTGMFLCPRRALISANSDHYFCSPWAAENLRDHMWQCPKDCHHDH